MRVGTPYKHAAVEDNADAIVIGSGIGGLAVAALLAKYKGKRVLVLERHYAAGGFTHTFKRPGYEWDVGVHYVGETAPGAPLRRAFDNLSNGQLAWADMGAVYDTVVIAGERYEFPKGREAWRNAMHGYFPSESGNIDRYLALVDTTAAKSQGYFADKVLPKPVSAMVGGLLRRPALRLGRRTTLDVLQELTRNPRLIAVLAAQYGDYGLPPAESSFLMHAMVARHYLDGGSYPVGGASRIAATIVPTIESAGGQVLTGAAVNEILVRRGRATGVRLLDGNELHAPVVISDTGVLNTFGRLLCSEIREAHRLDELLGELQPSMAFATLYLGFTQTAAQLQFGKSNVWVFPHEDHDRALMEFAAGRDAPLPLAYLSFPAAKDPEFEQRHPGRATAEVLTVAPFGWFERWQERPWMKRGESYAKLKKWFGERMLEVFLRECPQASSALDHCELSSPLSTTHFTDSERGAAYGVAHTPKRFAQSWLRPQTPIRGLYLTGADVCTAGVGGALFGGALTASHLLHSNLIMKITR